jgi:hypothetical protein
MAAILPLPYVATEHRLSCAARNRSFCGLNSLSLPAGSLISKTSIF